MTAIAVLYASEGFVMAADGRSTSDDDAERFLITDKSQKIFSINDKSRTLAFSLAGLAASADGEFDAYKEAMKHASELADREFENLRDYAEEFYSRLNNSYNQAKDQGLIFPTMNRLEELNAWGISTAVLAGYFRGQPSWTPAHFFHYDQSQSEFEPISIGVQPGDRLFLGSDKIREFIYPSNNAHPPDPRFVRYIRPPASNSLEQSAEIAKAFIEAHCDPAALLEHREFCKRVGGHIHIAEITPEGFRWRIPPETS